MGKINKYFILLALALSGGSIYLIPYIKYVFYDPQLAAMHINNEQSGVLLTLYAIGCMVLYIPSGIIADRLSPKKSIIFSLLSTSAVTVIYGLTLSYFVSKILWLLLAFTTVFFFWSSLLKAIRLIGNDEEQGRLYGLYYAGNGITGALANAIALWVFSRYTDQVSGFRAVVFVYAAFTVFAAFLVGIFLKEDKSKDLSTKEEDKFHFGDAAKLIKDPTVWLISLTIFCTYGLYSSTSYFTPYLTDVIGVPVESSGAATIVRNYIFMLLAPLGGIVADKMKSTSKWYMISFTILVIFFAAFLALPKGANSSLVIVLSLLPGAISLMMYGIMFSIIGECQIPVYVTGTAIGIASIVGYAPDLFFSVMFGRWLDKFGNTGYVYIFMFLAGLGVLGFILAFLIRKKTRNLPKENIIGNGL